MLGILKLLCFNTSYVAVELISIQKPQKILCSFNTSYVAVELPLKEESICSKIGFNTSYVAVEHIMSFYDTFG